MRGYCMWRLMKWSHNDLIAIYGKRLFQKGERGKPNKTMSRYFRTFVEHFKLLLDICKGGYRQQICAVLLGASLKAILTHLTTGHWQHETIDLDIAGFYHVG